MNASFQQNPMHVANMAQRMAKNAEGSNSLVFERVAMVSMGAVAAASVMQILAPLLRDLNRKYDEKGRGQRAR
jgi:hypothetical protein